MSKKKQKNKFFEKKRREALELTIEVMPYLLNKGSQLPPEAPANAVRYIKNEADRFLKISDQAIQGVAKTVRLVTEYMQKTQAPVYALMPIYRIDKIHKMHSNIRNQDYHFMEVTYLHELSGNKIGQKGFKLMEEYWDEELGKEKSLYTSADFKKVFGRFTNEIVEEKEVIRVEKQVITQEKKTGLNKKQVQKATRDYLHEKKKKLKASDYLFLENEITEFAKRL
jgi:hypothetical protein